MSSAPVLYQETRIPATPVPGSILHINAAGNSAVTVFGAGRKRPFDEISGLDEESYANKYLATEGSIFFRPKTKAPRSFLWRVLNDRQVLEVQCVDLVLDQKHAKAESWLTFHIDLPAPIIPGGVALADAEEKDALDIFVLTASNELYTITLRRELLVRNTVPLDFDSSTCVKRMAPGQLSYKRPYRLFAVSNNELVITLHDGSMVRLERQKDDIGGQWRETNYGERGLVGSFRGLIPGYKPQTVRYGDSELFGDAITAIAKSTDGKYIWTVTLDHMLKAWSVETGKVVAVKDLLDEGGEAEDRKKYARNIMSPEQGTQLHLVRPPRRQKVSDTDPYFLVTYLPKTHEFKFFDIETTFTSIEGDRIDIQDAQPRANLVPPVEDLMNTNIWHLEDFVVFPGPQWQRSQLWIRVRSGSSSRTFTLEFDLLDKNDMAFDLEEMFKTGWSVVDASYGTVDELRRAVDLNGIDPGSDGATTPSERWLKYIFYPGRFSQASIETALHIYRKGRNLISTSSGRGAQEPLKERISNAVSAKILLKRSSNEQPDFDQYQQDLHGQWTTFFSLLAHLHSRRHEVIGSAFDAEEGLAWTVCADLVAPIRASSAAEKLGLNSNMLIDNPTLKVDAVVKNRIFTGNEDVVGAQVLAVARQLRQFFSGPSQDKLKREALLSALEHGSDVSVEETLQLLDTQCNFADEIGDEEFTQLESAADQFGTFGGLTDDQFLMVLENIEDSPVSGTREKDGGQVLGRYGRSMSVLIVQETLQRAESVLLDLLALVVFMHCELEQSELSPDFRPKEVYEAIMLHLRRTELRLWLCSNVRQESVHPTGRIVDLVTIYESMFARDWQPVPRINSMEYGLPELLTAWSKRWAFGLDLSKWGDDITAHILADLLLHDDIELALDFVAFLPDTPWICYLKGRLYVSTGDYELASFAFQDAAHTMATLKDLPSPVVSQEEAQELFGQGLVFYFKHITALFEKAGVPSYTADFASMALDDLNENDLDQSLMDLDLRKSQEGSHQDILGNTMEEIRILKLRTTRDSLLCSKFNALNQTGRFALAFDALSRVNETEKQSNCLRTLLETCIKSDSVAAMLELDVQGDLAQEADAILLGLAKKAMASGLPSGPPYHQILFAFRTQQSNFRGAAAILYEHLERLRKSNKLAVRDPDDDTLPQMYVLLINTLGCCGEDQAWLLADPIEGVHGVGSKRKLVTLEDVKRDYTAELDRRSEISQGRFPLIGGDDEMEMF
ncbi:hypothetical protein M409DRAFT_62802 [Zasmidium cellare ATCC 36951]|uniref:Uncharacterized protein n=1 Tax=Zasmidium cellare ATCC 36951 TaxID=1080233 RepID=A0A6A6D2C0_ZASCE|nr:uncharacterized protein M409DRAFT_62802 [Zasmidium cellare ATCC 36951]KAF2173233.1 hypothetical protein M409DRAFT_62802 [Zasmidium cellare ATCC 36951]